MTAKPKYFIRDMDADVVREARASAVLQGKTMGDWWSEAGREKLAREKVSTPSAETGEVRKDAGDK